MYTTWQEFLKDEQQKEYYIKMKEFLDHEYKQKEIYPPKENILQSFYTTPLDQVKVVVIGQDPYHQPGQAHGLAFSVSKGVMIPPSLLNIYKELRSDLGYPIPNHGHLESWAKQGVLLLNNVLTVEYNKPTSHKDIGWKDFNTHVLELLNQINKPIVFILWGKHAQSKKKYLNNKNHLIIEAPHPSPLSAFHGFFGSKPFSKTNHFLIENNETPIDWEIGE